MSAQVLDGKQLANSLKEQLHAEITTLVSQYKKAPHIVSIVVGDDPAGLSYALSQQRTAESLGIKYELQRQPETITQQGLLKLIVDLNAYQEVHGVILNKPLPAHLNFDVLVKVIDPRKDIERINMCTPAAAIALLKSSGVSLAGKEAVVLGRSEIVGRPVAMLLLDEHVTVTVCHSATSKAGKLEEHIKRADIVIAAIGKPHFLKGEWLKPGAIVIDVGINEVNGKIVGDVDFDSCVKTASFISPVPGGVGPVTSVILMQNAIKAYRYLLCHT